MRCRFLGTRYFVLRSHRRLGARLCLICVRSRVVFRWLLQLNGSSYVIHLRVFDFPIFDLLALRLMIRSTVGSTSKMSESDRQMPVIVENFLLTSYNLEVETRPLQHSVVLALSTEASMGAASPSRQASSRSSTISAVSSILGQRVPLTIMKA